MAESIALSNRFLCIHLPHWSITRRLRRDALRRDKPGPAIVVVTTIRRCVTIVGASPAARHAGARVGLTLAEARAVCPAITAIEHDPAGDRRALDALGRWMTRFTPAVATGWTTAKDDDAPPPVLVLDVGGCERLFGSIEAIVQGVTTALARFGLPARVAAAPTVGAAWALAAFGRRQAAAGDAAVSSPSAAPDAVRRAVTPLPVEALRLAAPVVAALRRLGLVTIGHLLDLPRDTLPSRFGQHIITRIDQLLGARPEPLVPLAYDPPVEAKMTFEHTIDSLDTLWLVLQELIRRVTLDLVRRGHGARQVELLCAPDPATPWPAVKRDVQLNRPSRDPKRLFELLRAASEKLNCGRGFMSVHLKIVLHERADEEQIGLLDDQAHADGLELGRLVERLCARLGTAAVVRPAMVQSYLPERAWRPAAANERDVAVAVVLDAPRPLRLLDTPAEIKVIAEPSDDWSGRPAQFTHDGRVHRLVHVIGPERIAGEWWRGHSKTRDYYDALDEAGMRFWLFRVVALAGAGQVSKRWFLHGVF